MVKALCKLWSAVEYIGQQFYQPQTLKYHHHAHFEQITEHDNILNIHKYIHVAMGVSSFIIANAIPLMLRDLHM